MANTQTMMKPSQIFLVSPLRLGVFVARATGMSRRKAFEAVLAGRVRCNGTIVLDPSVTINPTSDDITLDGEHLSADQKPMVVLFHKPKGVTCTRWDPHAEKTVTELLPESWRCLFPIGRLDKDSEGLLVLTNCGDIAEVFSHPRYEVRKRYRVWLKTQLTSGTIKRLLQGQQVKGERLVFDEIRLVGRDHTGFWMYDVILHEGRKRHVRRLLAHVGHPVQRLMRLQQGPLRLGDLSSGRMRCLNEQEMQRLRQWCRRRLREVAPHHGPTTGSRPTSKATKRQTKSNIKTRLDRKPKKRTIGKP